MEFLISTNPGEEPRPLGMVASGGELSRIMLAIKTVLVGSRNCEAARPLFSTDKRRSADLKEYSYNLKPFMSVEFYSTTKFVSSRLMASPPSSTQAAAEVQLRRLWKAGVLQKARAWPHENGLIVWDNVILYVIDEKALNVYKKQFAQEFHKQPQKTP